MEYPNAKYLYFAIIFDATKNYYLIGKRFKNPIQNSKNKIIWYKLLDENFIRFKNISEAENFLAENMKILKNEDFTSQTYYSLSYQPCT